MASKNIIEANGMPWKIEKRDNKYAVVKESDGSVSGMHDTEDEAMAQMRALHASENHSYMMFLDGTKPDDYAKVTGEPIRILPQGRWYRGDKILDLTRERLQQVVANFKKGLPKFRVGINLDHAEDGGKVGDIQDLAFLDEGPQGPGVYATKYELSAKGNKAVDEDGYDAVSAEVVWTLNGAKYQDPETGEEHDNVLTGMALTPRPFFGHREVALFSYDKPQERIETMADDKSADLLVAKTAEADKLSADLKLKGEEVDKLTAKIEADRVERRKEVLKGEADSFEAISLKTETYVDTMLELEKHDQKLADTVKGWLKGADEAAKAIGAEVGSDLPAEGSSSAKFVAAVDGLMKADKLSYQDAFKLAEQKFPELAKQYAGVG